MLSLGNRLSLSTIKNVSGSGVFSNDYSLSFDGTNDYVTCGNDTSLQIVGDLTVAFWIKTDASENKTLVAKDDATNRCWMIQIRSNGKIRFVVVNSNTAVTKDSSDDEYNDDQWHHVVCVFDKGNNMHIYKDGSLDVTKSSGIPATLDNDAAQVSIGAKGNGAQPFGGYLDEVSIWGTKLSAAEIATIYNSGTAIHLTSNQGNYTSASTLQGYWRFESEIAAGLGASDHSQNNNKGNLVNSPTHNTVTPPN